MTDETDRPGSGGLKSIGLSRSEALLLLLLVLLALGLRVYALGRDSLWLDEICQVLASDHSVWQTVLRSAQDNGNTPLDYVVTSLALRVGRSEGVLRLPAALWGTLSVAVLYALGREMFDKRTGFLAAFLLTIMPMHVYYSRELRFYSLSIFLTLLSLYAFVRALDRDARTAWVAYGAATLLALYSHYYVLVVVGVEGVWLLWSVCSKRRSRPVLARFMIAAGIAVLLFLPWVGYDMYYEQVYKGGLLDTGFRFTFPPIANLLGGLFVRGIRASLLSPSAWFVGLAWVLIAVGGALALRRRSPSDEFTILLIAVMLAGMAAVLLLDYIASYFFATRQLVVYTPVAILVVSAAFLRLFRAAHSWLARKANGQTAEAATIVCLAVLSVLALWQPLSSIYTARKEDWRGAARYLLQHVEADDVLVAYTTPHLGFYLPELTSQMRSLRADPAYLEEMARSFSRVWIFDVDYLSRNRFPRVVEWIQEQQLVAAPFGDTWLRIYVYSQKVSRDELLEDVSRPGPRAGK